MSDEGGGLSLSEYHMFGASGGPGAELDRISFKHVGVEDEEEDEEDLEEISTGGAVGSVSDGSIEGYSLPLGAKPRRRKKKKKKDLQENDELVDNIADYLLSKLGV